GSGTTLESLLVGQAPPSARQSGGSGHGAAASPVVYRYCGPPPSKFFEARSIQFCSAWVGYFCVGPALTFEVSATEAVARISVAMRVLNMVVSVGCLGGRGPIPGRLQA